MKTIYFILFLSLASVVNANTIETLSNENPNTKCVHKNDTTFKTEPKSSNIAGLKIVSYDSQKYGKHIYVVSDIYTKKKVTFYNNKGEKVYSKATIGSPIYLSKLETGVYKVKIVEGKKTEIREFAVN